MIILDRHKLNIKSRRYPFNLKTTLLLLMYWCLKELFGVGTLDSTIKAYKVDRTDFFICNNTLNTK